MPNSLSPPPFGRASISTTSCPSIASRCAQASPAGPAPTTATRLPGRRRAGERMPAPRHQRVGGEALQPADLHRLALGRLAHAGLLAQRLGRADPRAHAARGCSAPRIVRAAASGAPVAIWRMNSGMSIEVGQAATQGAS